METTAPILDLAPSCQESIIEQIIATAAERIFAAQGSQGGLKVARAWIAQDNTQVAKYGAERASHYVYWYAPDGRQKCKSCGPGVEGKRNAAKLKRQIEAQLLTGTYESGVHKLWEEFREEYTTKILATKASATQEQVTISLNNFERISKPKKVSAIKTQTIDSFAAVRRNELHRHRSVNPQPVSASTVNTDLRNIKTVLRVAIEWGYLKDEPRFRFLKMPKKLPVYVIPTDFAKIYLACETAYNPVLQGIAPADWWRALLVMCYVSTGWRIGQLLALRREDLDLDAGTAIARACVEGNKAKEDRRVKLHPVAIAHLRKIQGFTERVFEWPLTRRTLEYNWYGIQEAGEVDAHYGFHAIRKAFGSMNASRLEPSALQHLMQHSNLQTTLDFYVNPLAEQEAAVGKLYVPDCLRGETG